MIHQIFTRHSPGLRSGDTGDRITGNVHQDSSNLAISPLETTMEPNHVSHIEPLKTHKKTTQLLIAYDSNGIYCVILPDLFGCKPQDSHWPTSTMEISRVWRWVKTFYCHIWWFPEMGVPPNHPFLDGIFPYKPTSYWGYPHGYGNPPYLETTIQKNPLWLRTAGFGGPMLLTGGFAKVICCSKMMDFSWRPNNWPSISTSLSASETATA